MHRTEHSVPATGRFAALSTTAVSTFLSLLVALHFIKNELAPSWHFISEYAIGRNGWMMTTAFLALAIAWIALERAVRSILSGRASLIGRVCMLASAAGLTIAAVFVSDPMNTLSSDTTIHGTFHNIGGTLGLAMPLAVALIGWQLSRQPNLRPHRTTLRWASGLTVATSLAAAAIIGALVSSNDGRFGPDVPVGWPNRIEMLAVCVWLAVAGHTIRTVVGTPVDCSTVGPTERLEAWT